MRGSCDRHVTFPELLEEAIKLAEVDAEDDAAYRWQSRKFRRLWNESVRMRAEAIARRMARGGSTSRRGR